MTSGQAYLLTWLMLMAVFSITILWGWTGFTLTYGGLSLVTCALQIGRFMTPMDWFLIALFSPPCFATTVSDYFE